MRRLLLVGLGSLVSVVALLSFAPRMVAADASQAVEDSVAGASTSTEADSTGAGIDFKKLLPAGWVVTYIDGRARPHGWDQSPTEVPGISIRVEGPRSIKGCEGGAVSEALTLWIMPWGFVRARPTSPGPLRRSAKRLGLISRYGKRLDFISGWRFVYAEPEGHMASWPNWEQDLRDYFEIEDLEQVAAVPQTESWRAEEEKALRYARQFLRDDEEIRLSVSWIEPTGDSTIFLGGAYRECTGSYRSALLVSRDGGETWRDTAVWLRGSQVCAIRSLDGDYVWCLVSWAIEGRQAPYYVFSSSDSGRTWRRSHDLPEDIGISLSFPLVFSFIDPWNGLLIFQSSVGDICDYRTADGGVTWDLACNFKVKADDLPGFGLKSQIDNTQNEYRADTDRKNGVITILRRDQFAAPWRQVGEIPYYYRLKGIELEPRKMETGSPESSQGAQR